MQISFYKPNSKNSGCGMSFQFNKDIGFEHKSGVMVNAILQYSWNPDTKQGNFIGNKDNPDANVVVKLNTAEASEILSILDSSPILFGMGIVDFPMKFSAYHTFGENSTTLSLYPLLRKKFALVGGKKQETSDLAYSFGIVQNSVKKFSMLFTHGEGRQLKEFLQVAVANSHGELTKNAQT